MSLNTDITVKETNVEFENVKLCTPLQFGSGIITELTYAFCRVYAENKSGQGGSGFGSILLSDLWAYPSKSLSHDRRDAAMRTACERITRMFEGANGHPIDIAMERKQDFTRLASELTEELKLEDPLPLLAALVCSAPVDAAVHDAFGKANNFDSYLGYGSACWANDLSVYLGEEFKGLRPDRFLSGNYKPTLPLFHLVGGADPLTDQECENKAQAQHITRSLQQWIRDEGVYCFKVKLKGTDPDADVCRTAGVADVAIETLEEMGKERFYLTVDSNEMCPDPDSVVEYLDKLASEHPVAYDALLYLEQPTARDLEKDHFDMREVVTRKPVFADEGVTSFREFELARELGWSGIALKVCKGHTSALLSASASEKWKMQYSVQDLTNPGISLLQSAGLAARLNPVMGVEANARQFLADPERELKQQRRHPGIFNIKNGVMRLDTLNGPGLGYRLDPNLDL